jgi:hypothetical protein
MFFIYLTLFGILQLSPFVPLPWKGRGNYWEERLRLSRILLLYLPPVKERGEAILRGLVPLLNSPCKKYPGFRLSLPL